MSHYLTSGSSGGVPSVVLVVAPDGDEEMEQAEHLTPAEAIALGSELFRRATETAKFIEITRDDRLAGVVSDE